MNANVEFSDFSFKVSSNYTFFGYGSVGPSITISPMDILNSDISLNVSESIKQDNTARGFSVGVKPLGILSIIATRYLPQISPYMSPSPAGVIPFNTDF